ncbi:unnamed protein product [Haemonchus placei]|uniref:BLM10_mid domain-containing protein n=1 Tax=Haemonchus placei TaxID=6290 RepID=A0A158QLU8_HAEPC|nr:unnamed protein product [Haemonchus placei]
MKFTEAILPSLLYALYSKDSAMAKAPAKLVMILCALCPSRVLPKVLEHIYSAIFAVDEPHRLIQTLNCLVELVFLISQDNNLSPSHTPMEKDWILEMEKNITLVFYMVPILDYSDCIQYHSLTDKEKALCKMSPRLPVLAGMALDKILSVIECIAVTAPKDSSTVIGNFKDLAAEEGSEEKLLKKAINRCVAAIFKNANQHVTSSGAQGLWNSLYMLSRVYPESSRYMALKLNRPLKEWIPIREWSRLYKLDEMKMAWHIPSEKGKAVIEEILKKFLFPIVDEIMALPVDRERLKKAFTIINSIFTGGAICFAMPPSPLYPCPRSLLPWFNPNIPNAAVYKMDIRHPSGKNVREMLVDLFEEVINRAEKSQREHSQVLVVICSLLHYVIHVNFIDSAELLTATDEQNEVFGFLSDPIKRELPEHVYGAAAYVCHMKHATSTSTLFSEFHLRVTRLLLRLALNVYPEVRFAAQTELFSVFAEYDMAKEAIVDNVISVLADQNSSKEKIKGALIVIWKSNLAIDSTKQTRIKIWQTLLEMKALEIPALLEVYEEICNQIATMQMPIQKHYECKQLINHCEMMLRKLHRTGEWAKFNSEKSLELTRKDFTAFAASMDKAVSMNWPAAVLVVVVAMTSCWSAVARQQEELVHMLLKQFARKDLLHTRAKLCHMMLWQCQMEKAGLETIEVPETVPLRCGIRPDNLCLAYDSENLPNTEEKWNNTVFFSKQFGCYKWPETISVVVLAKQAQIDRPELNECEKTIVAAFEDPQLFFTWISILIFEKRDIPELKESTIWIVKRAHQRLAAEIFAGVAQGTKYRGFKVLNDLWTTLSQAVDLMYDYMNADAYNLWSVVMIQVLQRDDTRRYWWLIEQFLKGMSRPAPTAWHRAVRLLAMPANRWREVETRRRICEIAWRDLPKAKIDTQRLAISTSLKNICVLMDANMNNDFKDLPERFRLESADYCKSGQDSTQGSKTSLAKAIPTDVSMNKAINKLAATSAATSNDDKPQIYLRTLLEFLLQYYENCITCLTPSIISLFPVLLEYANQDDAEYELHGSLKDMDIKLSANNLIHDSMSSLFLTSKFADSFLGIVAQAYLNDLMKSKSTAVLHGGILGMAAVVRAHPFSTTPAVKTVLRALCEVTGPTAEHQRTATTAIREFRRTHRENWESTARFLGSDLVFKIENAIAPLYYA